MNTFKTSIRLKDAGSQDYDKLDQEMETQQFKKLQATQRTHEYHYRGPGSLQEVTAATYRAANNTGKQYTFTIIRQKAS